MQAVNAYFFVLPALTQALLEGLNRPVLARGHQRRHNRVAPPVGVPTPSLAGLCLPASHDRPVNYTFQTISQIEIEKLFLTLG
jgi:hypothetical protein